MWKMWTGLEFYEIDDIIKSNITVTDTNLYEAIFSVVIDAEVLLMDKNASSMPLYQQLEFKFE